MNPGSGYSAKCFNVLVDVLKAAAQGGTGDLPMEAGDIFAGATPQAGNQRPFLLVRLPQEPYSTFEWGGTSALKTALFVVDVDVVDEVAPERSQPYGSEALPGILTLADDVMDVLENGRDTILAASGRIVDYAMTASAHSRSEGDGRTIVATIRVAFKVRFFAGQRSALP